MNGLSLCTLPTAHTSEVFDLKPTSIAAEAFRKIRGWRLSRNCLTGT